MKKIYGVFTAAVLFSSTLSGCGLFNLSGGGNSPAKGESPHDFVSRRHLELSNAFQGGMDSGPMQACARLETVYWDGVFRAATQDQMNAFGDCTLEHVEKSKYIADDGESLDQTARGVINTNTPFSKEELLTAMRNCFINGQFDEKYEGLVDAGNAAIVANSKYAKCKENPTGVKVAPSEGEIINRDNYTPRD